NARHLDKKWGADYEKMGAKQFYESIFDCHRESIENKIRKFIKEFE
ncbi:4610_t:CDS:2, partial [Paraglomus brasilianum]